MTIDTEEEGLWSGDYPLRGEVTNIRGVPRFQELCDRFSIRPTYLVDAPVVCSREAVEILRPIQEQDRAEIGAHVHPWNTPPTTEERCTRNSYLCNLSPELQSEKIGWLTDTIETAFGRRPRSFRAGRYGLDICGARALVEHGYRVDSSVIPLTDYTAGSGPNFSDAPMTPYFVGGNNLIEPHDSGDLYEVPVTVGYTHRYYGLASRMRSIAHRSPLRQMRMVGILDRLGLASRIKLSPEQADARRMMQLAQSWLQRHHPILVLMFHSSSLVPGFSPYVRDDHDLNNFLGRLETVFEFCLDTLGAKNCTLRECSPNAN
ncbi:MAG: polysaccharide deacetylase family protein [Planctomycetales bacterium]|nr:polysaccharide deacetylase family protein [Planctomycetales bacterium]